MLHKKSQNLSQTLSNFHRFLKKRNEKQTILNVRILSNLQSPSETILQKVHSFEELLTLTKTGQILTRPETTHQKSKNNFKIFRTCKFLTYSDQHENSKILKNEEESNTEDEIIKFDNMTNQLHKWEISNKNSNHISFPQEQKKDKKNLSLQERGITRPNPKTKPFCATSAELSRVISEKDQNLKENLDFFYLHGQNYAPIQKRSIKTCPKKITRKLQKYEMTVESPFQIQGNQNKCTKLIKKIENLEENAKEKYGISFLKFKELASPQQFLIETKQIATETKQVPMDTKQVSMEIEQNLFEESKKLRELLFDLEPKLNENAAEEQNGWIPKNLLGSLCSPNLLRSKHGKHYVLKSNNYLRMS